MSKLVLGLVCALLLVSTSVAQPLTKWQSVKVASVSTSDLTFERAAQHWKGVQRAE